MPDANALLCKQAGLISSSFVSLARGETEAVPIRASASLSLCRLFSMSQVLSCLSSRGWPHHVPPLYAPDAASSGSPEQKVNALVSVDQIAQLVDLEAEGHCVECLTELGLSALDPAKISGHLAGLQGTLTLRQLAAPLSEYLPGGVRDALLEDPARHALRLATGPLDLLVSHLVDGAPALAVLQEYVSQADLLRLLPLALGRRLRGGA
mmetsp:Transcript_59959/g.159486  ORF Transcript_59959/g.159486 Transcript_59959/m.159486 type:complete len:209 (+) Transcript_59959:226-852(+)